MSVALRRLRDPAWLPSAVAIVLLWCTLWGTWSVANVLSGLAVATATRAVGLLPVVGRMRFVPFAKLCGFVLVDLVKSTWVVAAEVLTPTDRTDEAIIRIDRDLASGLHRFVFVVSITLTPGTAAVGFDDGCIEVHLLHRERRDELERHVRRLAALIEEAFVVDAPDRVDSPDPAEHATTGGSR